MKLFKLSATALSLMAFPLLATAAPETAAPIFKKIIGKCSFEAPDQSQEEDCFAKFVLCSNEHSVRECRSVLKVKCGKTTEFAGPVDVSVEDDRVILEGEESSRFPDPPTLTFDKPSSLPATEDAELDFDSVELEGTCKIKKAGNTHMLQ